MLATQLHCDEQAFRDFDSFRPLLEAGLPHWPSQVLTSLRLIALHGIRDPLNEAPIAASQLSHSGDNHRESLSHGGLVSRQRATLLLLRRLIEAGQLPRLEQLRLYIPEAVTPLARLLAERVPHTICSEYLPEGANNPFSGRVMHQDLCALTLPDASLDLVICNELFEHVYDLGAALAHLARVLVPGGRLIGTFPFAYNRQASITKARHRAGAEPELLEAAEIHGNPVDPSHGSLVYQIPGWEILDRLRAAGFRDALIHWIDAPSYGVVGAEMPAVLVLEAER